ncbi:ERCC8 [Branchiostoma lanceolatum]|uniref:DNA excision repair protein ERCC-8 n=1 Tax=Branchiostoma lanceolatum TaxID=7740 RepID=A0A8J9YWV0_BRALA|nr:ERCC8 [Branchiostoma lanceolatum]
MLNFLSCRENGTLDPLALVRAEATRRTFSLELSKEQDVKRIHASGVNSLDLDPVEGRYLISGGADGVIAIYDTHNLSGTPSNTSEAVCTVGRSHRHVHKYSVETVRWYPHDTGLFTSSSMDKTLKVWDTNVLLPAEVFQFEGTVYSHAMSPVAKKHCLIAVATMTSIVTLCDLKSGSSTHILKGHRAAVKCARWSPRNPYLLATGSQDNKVLLWDVRSAKSSLMSLDQHNGELATSTAAVNTAHNGHVNGLCFTPEGLHLLSFGTDNRLRLWDTATGRNTLVNYGKICNESKKSVQFTVSCGSSPDVVFVPDDSSIAMFDVFGGTSLHRLVGHYNYVQCCVFNPDTQELYSGGSDSNILVWVPDLGRGEDYEESKKQKAEPSQRSQTTQAYQDTWSSDED